MITTLLLLYTNMAAMTSHANQELVVVLPKRIFGFLSYAPSDQVCWGRLFNSPHLKSTKRTGCAYPNDPECSGTTRVFTQPTTVRGQRPLSLRRSFLLGVLLQTISSIISSLSYPGSLKYCFFLGPMMVYSSLGKLGVIMDRGATLILEGGGGHHW